MNPPQVTTSTKKPVTTPVKDQPANKSNEIKKAAAVAAQGKEPSYNGPEQRKEQRRLARDRRDIIRYELKKDDRRVDGRRATDKNPWLKYQG